MKTTIPLLLICALLAWCGSELRQIRRSLPVLAQKAVNDIRSATMDVRVENTVTVETGVAALEIKTENDRPIKVEVENATLDVNIENQSLEVTVSNTPLDVSIDNEPLHVRPVR